MAAREDVANAVYNLVNAAVGAVVGLQTSSRRLRDFQELDPPQMPALFMTQPTELVEQGALSLPAKRTLRVEFWLYTADPQADSVFPATQLNLMIDAIETALGAGNPDVTGGAGPLLLNGVYVAKWVRIDGEIRFHENVENTGKSAAIVPVSILRP